LIQEFELIAQAVQNNAPAVINEIHSTEAQQRRLVKRYAPPDFTGGIAVTGPVTKEHLEAFGARLGLAMHFERTGRIVPTGGAALAIVASNIDLLDGLIPDAFLSALPPPSTLQQGKKNVSNQFRYATGVVDGGEVTGTFASFNFAFGVVVAVYEDRYQLEGRSYPAGIKRYRPGNLRAFLPKMYSLSARFIIGGPPPT
jgi:hypothetical protein